jgi:pSer/pThr/pTyr-binding forkhead associated (FHA) protein
VGRGGDADLRINDPGISRTHAQFVVTGSGSSLRVRIVDLNSTNGILVDGRKVTEAELGDGSRIDMGKTAMLIYAPSGS